MVQRAVEGAYKQSGHRAVTSSQTNKNREEASKQGASSRFVSGRLPRAGNLPKGFRASAGDWTAPSSVLPSGAKLPNQAHAKETAGRTPARGSAVQRPTQRIATADAARCDGQCSALRRPTCTSGSFRSGCRLGQGSVLHTAQNHLFPIKTADFIAHRTLSAHFINPS